MSLKNKIDAYRNNVWDKVPGWVEDSVISTLEIISSYQDEHKIDGDILEIGVFHGRFFLLLLEILKGNENGIALDIFDKQILNIDHSGTDQNLLNIFKESINIYATNPNSVKILAADSMTVRPSQLLQLSSCDKFRIISVDGGHTAEHVINDLSLSASIISTGGIIFIDDWGSPHWPGVQEGYIKYMMHKNHNLSPVFYIGNKLLLTTITTHDVVLEWMRGKLSSFPQEIREVSSCGFKFLSAV